jgi:hypothetical protein
MFQITKEMEETTLISRDKSRLLLPPHHALATHLRRLASSWSTGRDESHPNPSMPFIGAPVALRLVESY